MSTIDLFSDDSGETFGPWSCVASGALWSYHQCDSERFSITLRHDRRANTWRASAGRLGGSGYWAHSGEQETPDEAVAQLRRELGALMGGLEQVGSLTGNPPTSTPA